MIKTCFAVAAIAVLCLSVCQPARADFDLEPVPDGAETPVVQAWGMVAPDVLWIRVREFHVTPASLTPYEPQPGDEIRPIVDDHGVTRDRKLFRDGREVGSLSGPEGNVHLYQPRGRIGEPLDRESAYDEASYKLDAPSQEMEIRSVAVKRSPVGSGSGGPAVQHDVYLKLAEPMSFGEEAMLDLRTNASLGGETDQLPITFGPMNHSPAVQASQVGYRPSDPLKVAFLSQWMGSGGPYLEYEAGTPFQLRDAQSGEVVYEGETRMRLAGDEESAGFRASGRNFAGTDVLVCDFSDFTGTGEFVVSVDNVGASKPFSIRDGVWNDAFHLAMRGILHQRSGIAWETPVHQWNQPRAMHPGDGHVVYDLGKTRLSLVAEHGNHESVMDGFEAMRTDTVVPNAWGGYRDAADHDRHTGHIVVGHRLLELYELFPEHFKNVELNIPEAGDDMPDLLDEAVWVVDFFKRLQRDDGGVYGGIESNGHPSRGEPSYLDQLGLYAFTPDVQSTWRYAAVAAHAAHVMRLAGFSKKADDYLASARRAMDWAEETYERDLAELTSLRIWWEVQNDRNLAAAHLYRATGEELYHEIFEESCGMLEGELPFLWESHDNLDAAFVYARLPDDMVDASLKETLRASLVRFADDRMKYQDGQAFMWTARDDGAPLLGGFASAPKGRIMSVAHVLTGDEKYLAATIGSTMASVGANPKNMTFTTGLGHAWPEFPMQVDRDVRGEPVAWPGQTLYGLHDQEFQPLPDWVTTWVATPETTEPAPQDWPVMESFFDINSYLMMNENTVWQTGTPTAYVWGYLSARESQSE